MSETKPPAPAPSERCKGCDHPTFSGESGAGWCECCLALCHVTDCSKLAALRENLEITQKAWVESRAECMDYARQRDKAEAEVERLKDQTDRLALFLRDAPSAARDLDHARRMLAHAETIARRALEASR